MAASLGCAGFADDDFSAVERQIIELHVEALAVLVRPGCADLGPVTLVLAELLDRIDAVRRAGRGFGLDRRVSFRVLRSPGWQPRCPFGRRCGSSERSKARQRLAVTGGMPSERARISREAIDTRQTGFSSANNRRSTRRAKWGRISRAGIRNALANSFASCSMLCVG